MVIVGSLSAPMILLSGAACYDGAAGGTGGGTS